MTVQDMTEVKFSSTVDIYDAVFQSDYFERLEDVKADSANKLLVGSIDQGTSSTKFIVYTQRTGRIAAIGQMEHEQYYPETGWHEHDPMELCNNTVRCITRVYDEFHTQYPGHDLKLAAIGITNQRETTISWNRITGIPYYNAIVWDCSRTARIADELVDSGPNCKTTGNKKDRFRDKTGLPISSYFAGTKVKWLLDNVDTLREDLRLKPNEVCFGTVDTWLLYNLTGKECYKTDVTNASRWLFLDIRTCQWDQELVDTICEPYNVPVDTVLPEISPSSHIFGFCKHQQNQHHGIGTSNNKYYNDGLSSITNDNSSSVQERLLLPEALIGVPIGSLIGDQQAALFGQGAFHPGHAKNTYGTGLFLMMNTGTQPVPSNHGLLTTVAYQIGKSGKIHYALEGSVSFSGSTIQWLRDQLQIISTASETETLATSSNDGLYFVPAFSGLLAPYWKSDARGCIVGMAASHHRGHICRAALEATAYQTRSVFDAITADCNGIALTELKVDGGGTNNKLLMQFQADIINVPVIIPAVMETTSIGAAFAAGLAVGVWDNLEQIRQLWEVSEIFQPTMSEEDRMKNWMGWKKAVERSFGWIDTDYNMDSTTLVNADNGYQTICDNQKLKHEEHKLQLTTPENIISQSTLVVVAVATLCFGFVLGSFTTFYRR